MATAIPSLPWATLTIPPASRLNGVSSGADARQLSAAGSRSVVPLTYGKDRIGGLLLNVLPASAGGTTLLVQVLWGFAGSAVEEVRLNGLALPVSATVTTYLGTQTTADSALVSAFAAQSITYTDTLQGYAYSVIALPRSAVGTELQITGLYSGRKLYDPRKDGTAGGTGSHRLVTPSTWEWSDCPALALADFLASPVYGAGESVDWASVATVANANDSTIGSPAEKRRLVGVSFIQPASVGDVAEALRAYAGCFLLPGASGIKLLADAAGSAVATYRHVDGTIAAIAPLQLRDLGNSPTVVEVIYTDTTVVPWRDGSAFAELPGVGTTLPYRLSQVRLPGVQRYSQARREAIERLNKLTLQDLSTTIEVFDQGIRHERGDIVSVSHPLGLAGKLFRITDLESPRPGVWTLPLIEYDPACYSDAVETVPTYANSGSLISEAVALADGLSVYQVEIFLQSASQPATPVGGQYTFTGDAFTAPSGGWSRSMPTSSLVPIWRTTYLATTRTPNVPINIPNGSGVSALLRLQGSNGSATFTDSSLHALSWANGGSYGAPYDGARISTTRAKFGSSSLLLDGQDIISGPANDARFLMTGDFGIHVWVYVESTSGMSGFGNMLAYFFSGLTDDVILNCSGTAARLTYGNRTVSNSPSISFVGRWVHVFAGRSGSNLHLAVDGVQATPVAVGTAPTACALALIGGTQGAQHYIGEWVVEKGRCQWTSDFSVPTEPFPTPLTGWTSPPTKVAVDGAAGLNNALVYIYQRASGTPTLPSATTTYTFATAALTGLNNGWTSTIPAGSNPLYVSVATASSSGATDTIAAGEWAAATVLAQNGAAGAAGSDGLTGAPGLNAATVYLFQRTATSTPPSLPSASVTYTFATGGAAGVNNGWAQALPTSGGAYRWVTTATAASTGSTDTISSGEWAAAAVLAEDGAAGVSSITGLLTNEATTVAADSTGTVSSFSGAGGTFRVFDGVTDKTGDAAVTYSVNASSGVSISIASTGVYTVSAMSADTGTATLRAVYAGVTLDKVYSISKSRAGISAVVLDLSANGVTLAADSTGYVASYAAASTTARVMVGNADDTANWTISTANSAGVTSSTSGAQVNVTAMTVDSGYVTITATRTGYPTQSKRFTITRVRSAGTTSGPVDGLNFASNGQSYGTSAFTGVLFGTDGTVQTDNGGGYGFAGNWFAPTTSGIGTTPGYWLKVTQVAGDSPGGAALATILALTSSRQLTYSVSGTGAFKSGDFSFIIYSDAGGTTQVAAGTFSMECQTAPFA